MNTYSSNREQHRTADDAQGAPSLPSDQDASGRSFGDEELAAVRSVLESGVLTSTKGSEVTGLEADFAALLGARHAIAASSGTAAIHAAVAAIDPEPGDEIVTTPITDMGAIAPILYQSAIPVFADVDPRTGNVTAPAIERCLSERTRAIVVTHLFGCPAEMDDILELADARGIPIIEDCAQAFLARSRDRLVGTLGALGCFSLQQGKHVTTGEGGIVVTDDDAIARRIRLFVNKGWPYGESGPDHEFLAPNYRMTELHGAVGRAQLRKLADGVETRIRLANRLGEQLTAVPGIDPPAPSAGDVHTYWRYCLAVDPDAVVGGPAAVAAALREHDISSAPRYIQKPAFRCAVIAEQRTFGASRVPFTLARPEVLDYSEARFPGTFAMLDRALVLPWNERYQPEHVDRLAGALIDAVNSMEPAR